ncbi:hypothetical protein VVD49_04830 [Uliginosibacterium sp. H3]|uniref:YARHG domain-containing protein n=1 Tax=Uliginosibacterium silvisoli TaxID=3114758 RepID=A0ABU6K1X0_9RHOO|nr:hypothetical protein [Uliginosibacterium sp. H3]
MKAHSILATLVMTAACASALAQSQIAAFSTDGCSLFPDRALVGQGDWCRCCLAHDLAYWRGGTAEERLQADKDLRSCVLESTQNKALAEFMYAGVRSGGGPQFSTTYRWAYGWPQGRGYQPLSEAERAQVFKLETEYRASNPGLVCKKPVASQ